MIEPMVFGGEDALAHSAADWILGVALESRGRCAVALSGGSTPARLYGLLAAPPYRARFPWDRVHWFWGDERFVAKDSARSNYRMAWEAMLSRAPAPGENIHAVATDRASPQAAADAYERTLQDFYGSTGLDPARPLFDIVLLGLGDDGHLASLFPGSPVLSERKRWVAVATGPEDEPRITLTYPVLESARHAAFLIAGAAKAVIAKRFIAGDPALPASRYSPAGALRVFMDKAAA
jgi:6-phosphogluconolactonase